MSKTPTFAVTPAKRDALIARMQACGVKETDIKESFSTSSGPGGQHVNKVATSVALEHLPSGISLTCSRTRQQSLNRYYARKELCQILENMQQGSDSPQNRKIEKLKKQKARRRRRAQKKASQS